MEARRYTPEEEEGAPTDLSMPEQPSESWRAARPGVLSGRYTGAGPAGMELELRVDIDPRYANSPVLNRISGDLYRTFRLSLPGQPAQTWRNYLESWIVDAPRIKRFANRVVVTGSVRFWRGGHPTTKLRLVIPLSAGDPTGSAEATFVTATDRPITYSCRRRSSSFRELRLEVDVCRSVNRQPLLPCCDTYAHDIHPEGLPRRVLTFEEAYREAGVEVKVLREHSILDDNVAGLERWSPAELHDAMETFFSQFRENWPQWKMWGLIAGSFDDLEVGGIMFDAAAASGGAGEGPGRQGFALFREHEWFRELEPDGSSSQTAAAAMRKLLYTFIHEAGHAFNFQHSWDKSRPDSLSWMNYDWRYDQRHGPDSFWENFQFSFDDEELLHLRHGDRSAVIMGGDPWSSGGHLEAPPEAMTQLEGNAPVELLVRSREVFDFMEPVDVELRLRNRLPSLPLKMDTLLRPEQGGVAIFIRRPDGQLRTYSPVLCKLALPRWRTLKPAGLGEQGEDRYSEEVFLGYGRLGFYFDQPGEYLVRAVYQGGGDLIIPSNVHRIRVALPTDRDQDRRAQDFFTPAVGLSLYLGGSASPRLRKGMATLEDFADRYKDSSLGARANLTVANSRARSFHSLEEARCGRPSSARPKEALGHYRRALDFYQKQEDRSFNLPHHAAGIRSFELLRDMGADYRGEAQKELATLIRPLGRRGVNEAVLRSIRMRAESL